MADATHAAAAAETDKECATEAEPSSWLTDRRRSASLRPFDGTLKAFLSSTRVE